MVAAPNRAKRRIKRCRAQTRSGEHVLHIAFPRVLEVEADGCPAINLGIATNDVRLEQCHAAADVPTDEVWIDHVLGYERRSDGPALSRVQIRKAEREPDSLEPGSRVE